MGWVLLFLVLIAAALGVLGLVVKATIFLVLTILMTVIVLGYVVYLIVRRQAKRLQKEFEKRLQPPSQDYRY
jgi:preprotein translocase subunit YajC